MAVFSLIEVASCVATSVNPSGGSFTSYSLRSFDLFYYFPWTIWLAVFGFGALLIALVVFDFSDVSPKLAYALMLYSLIMIFIVFFAMPYLAEPLPRYWDSWTHGAAANGIALTGHLTNADFNYQGYPASFIFLASIAELTGVTVESLLHILPLLLVVAFFTAFVYAANEITGNPKIAVTAALIYGVSTYYLTFHFSPEIFGWLLLLLLIALIAKESQISKQFSTVSRRFFLVISLLVLLAIGMTHPVSQAIALLAVVFLFLFRKRIWQGTNTTIGLVLLSAVIFSAWAAFFGTTYYSQIVLNFNSAIQSVAANFSSSAAIAHYANASVPSQIANLLYYRRALYVFVPVTGIFGFFFYRNKSSPKSMFLAALVLAGVLIASLTVFGILPVERSIELAFLPLSVFSGYLVVEKKKIGVVVLIFIVGTIPLNFAVYYWNEPFYMTHSWEVSSAQFISDNFHGNVLSDYKESLLMEFYNGSFSGVYTDYFLVGSPPNIFNVAYITANRVQLIYVSQLSLLNAQINGEQVDKNLTSDSNFDVVCSTYYSTVLYDQNTPNYTLPASNH